MRKLTLNQKRILYGTLIVTLGFSKSWLQTADASSYGHGDFALSTVDYNTGKVTPDQSKKVTRKPAAKKKPVAKKAAAEKASTEKISTPSAESVLRDHQESSTLPEESSSNSYSNVDTREVISGSEYKLTVSGSDKYTGHLETYKPAKIFKDGKFVANKDYTVVQAVIGECESCIDPIAVPENILRSSRTIGEIWSAMAKNPEFKKAILADIENKKKEKELADKEEKEAKEKAEKLANCEIDENGKELEDMTPAKFRCISKNIKNMDRKEKREAFDTDIVQNIQDALKNSTSAQERRDILKSVSAIQKELGSERELKQQLAALTRGVRDFDKITDLAQDSVLNPKNKLSNTIAIDNIAYSYNKSLNPQLARYYSLASANSKSAIDSWSDEIVGFARSASSSPEAIARKFFEDVNQIVGGIPGGNVQNGSSPSNGNNMNGQNARSSRVNFGSQYIPPYMPSSNNLMYSNQQRNGNVGGRVQVMNPNNVNRPMQQQGPMYRQPGIQNGTFNGVNNNQYYNSNGIPNGQFAQVPFQNRNVASNGRAGIPQTRF